MTNAITLSPANQRLKDLLDKRRAEAALKDAQKTEKVLDVVEKVTPTALATTTAEPIKSGSELSTNPEYAKAWETLCLLEQQLNDKIPEFAMTLREIHRMQSQDPNIVTIMTEEEIGIVLAGLQRHTAIEIIAPKSKTSKVATKRLANLDDSDI